MIASLHSPACSRRTLGCALKHRLVVIAIACCSASQARAMPPCLHYGGDPVALTGQVIRKTFYGPPNYGDNPKTDLRETQAILVLSKPICIDAGSGINEEAERVQRKVTLLPSAGFDPSKYLGKVVTVEGTLFHSHTGHHHTAVLMQTSGVKTGKK